MRPDGVGQQVIQPVDQLGLRATEFFIKRNRPVFIDLQAAILERQGRSGRELVDATEQRIRR